MAKVWLDAGHGGSDPGAVGNGLREKDLTLIITEHTAEYLEENFENVTVRLSRGNDKTVDLGLRDDLADAWDADVFLSTHINAGGGDGYESYIYNGRVSSNTHRLQDCVHDRVMDLMKKHGMPDRGQKRANFSVLRTTEMPAILTENLFIDTSNNAHLLKDKDFLRDLGRAQAEGLADYLGLKRKEKPKPKPDDVAGNDESVHRVIVNGKQVGAFGSAENVSDVVYKFVKQGVKKIEIERV